MFTGLIESVQAVREVRSVAGGKRLVIPLGELAVDSGVGASIAVNGVCLTVSDVSDSDVAHFDVMEETLRCTTLERLRVDDPVNLERAMRADGRFGGHLVSGHVEGVGELSHIERNDADVVFRFTAPADLIKWMLPKGSVTVDGVSLTLIEVESDGFSVGLIPTTLEKTNLGRKNVGDRVNLETDMIGKWVVHRLEQILPGNKRESITLEKLINQGFT